MASAGAAHSNSAIPKPERRRRGSITTESILTAAFELAEEVSISGLSMPLLAKRLGVGVTSLYWYFRKKEDLLDAMSDRATLLYDILTPFVEQESWQDGLRRHFRELLSTFRERPVLCDLILMRTSEISAESMGATIQKLEGVVAGLIKAGFTPDEALDVYLTLSLHIRGIAVLEHFNSTAASPVAASSWTPHEVTTPILYDLAQHGHSRALTSTHYEFTLEAIIVRAEGLLGQRAATRPSVSE